MLVQAPRLFVVRLGGVKKGQDLRQCIKNAQCAGGKMTEFFIGLGVAMLGFTLYWYIESAYGEDLVRWMRKNFK